MRAINATIMRQINRTLLLNHIRLRPISRAELAEETGLTRASVTQIVEELILEGFVQETSVIGRSRLGRRSTQLAIKSDAGVIFGVNLGLDQCTVGVMDMHGQVLRQNTELIAGRAPMEVLDAVAAIILFMEKDMGLQPSRIQGVGMSVPGPVNPDEGRMLYSPCMPAWQNMAVGPLLAERTGLPVYVETAADALVLEEMYFGQSGDNFILMRVDKAVSIGAVVQGRLYRGAPNFPSELGSCPAEMDDVRSLDELIAVPALLAGTPYRTWEELLDRCAQDVNCRLVDGLVNRLSMGILNIIHAFRIDRVVLAGDLGRCEPLLARLNAKVRAMCRLPGQDGPVCMGVESDAVRQGAASVYDTIFSNRALLSLLK